ncbi:hypothetical protein C8F04DRAFT_1181337 [Mycena alexandri]|uniref:Uncharacterized protein n=1 Tax=Mycena alexandri TaxID=1745969 RepID=A0AAD6SZQ9_9AGAR|nr:hypothetical protein C8F04DRAFT_1181337 [Mycena alexandri]
MVPGTLLNVAAALLQAVSERDVLSYRAKLSMPKVKPSAGQNSDEDEDEDDYSDDEELTNGPEPEPFCGSANSDEARAIALATQLPPLHWQAGTTTKSEKVLQIDSKYALSRIERAARQSSGDDTEPEKMTLQEASNLTRVVQDQNAILQESKPVKYREVRWKGITAAVSRLVNTEVLPNMAVKNVHQLNPLTVGHMTIMWNGTRFYIGEILDVYKKAGGEDSESDDDSDEEDSADIAAPLFSCHYKNYAIRLHTHAKIDHLLFNLGPRIFEEVEAGARHRTLKSHAARCWTSLTKRGKVSKELRKVTLKLPKNPAS